MAVVAGAGFFAGVRVEKGQKGGSASATSVRTAASGRTGTGTGGTGGGAGGGGAGGGAAGGRGRTIGQVVAIEGTSLLITDASGNTIKVTTTPSSRVTKTDTGSLSDIHPGDTVV